MKTNFCPKYYFYFHQNMLVIFDHHYAKGTPFTKVYLELDWGGKAVKKGRNKIVLMEAVL